MNFFTRLKMNMMSIIGWTIKIAGALFGVLSTLLSFVSWDELKATDQLVKISILLGILLVSFLSSCVLVVFILRRNEIWKKGKNSVSVSYGDLMGLAFNKRYKRPKIIVIPFNDTFDTSVEKADERTPKPLVSHNTLHGVWIKKFCEQGKIGESNLNQLI